MKKVIYHFCLRCDCKLENEKGLDYPFFCPDCDENMFSFEARKVSYKKKIKLIKNR